MDYDNPEKNWVVKPSPRIRRHVFVHFPQGGTNDVPMSNRSISFWGALIHERPMDGVHGWILLHDFWAKIIACCSTVVAMVPVIEVT